MGLIGGALAGAALASHWSKTGLWSEVILKGAIAGGALGAATDLLTPDVSKQKGFIGNVFGGAATGALMLGAGAVMTTGSLPGGILSKWMRGFVEKGGPKVAEWARKQGSEKGAKTVEKYMSDLSFGAGGLGFRAESSYWPAGFGGTPALAERMSGLPVSQAAAAKKGLAATGDPSFLKDLGGTEILNVLRKDVAGAMKHGLVGGALAGGIANFYYNRNRVPRDGSMGVYGGGMYRVTGLASNRALNGF